MGKIYQPCSTNNRGAIVVQKIRVVVGRRRIDGILVAGARNTAGGVGKGGDVESNGIVGAGARGVLSRSQSDAVDRRRARGVGRGVGVGQIH